MVRRHDVRKRVLRIQQENRRDIESGVPRIVMESNRCTCSPLLVRAFLWISSVAGVVLLGAFSSSGLTSVDAIISRDLQQWNDKAKQLLNNANNLEGVHQLSRSNACRRLSSHQDIRECYPSQVVKQFHNSSDPGCSDIHDWDQVQRCLTGRYHYNSNHVDIREIHIVGERNTGTKFVTKALQQCMPKADGIKVHRDFLRAKHFFQPIVRGDFSTSLIVAVVRDPVEWVAAMREKPYHSPSHVAGFDKANKHAVVPLPWREFVSKPWTTYHSKYDRSIANVEENQNKAICRHTFTPKQVVPCGLNNVTAQGPPWNIPIQKWRGYEPIYEQQPDGHPYDNLLGLRNDKIANWILQVPLIMQIGGFAVVRYEDLLQNGTEFFLQRIADIVASGSGEPGVLSEVCKPTPPQPERLGKRTIPDDFRAWVNENVNDETERLIGYR